jgi:hypothetical protein
MIKPAGWPEEASGYKAASRVGANRAWFVVANERRALLTVMEATTD